jgi:hypothetical protein
MARRKLKLLSIALATVAGIVIIALAGLAWLVAPHSPDLTPTQAKQIISATPEFNQSRAVVAVSETTRAGDSMADSLYFAKFTFTSSGATEPIAADAEFQFWNGGWHLQQFSYGERPDIEVVQIKSNVPPS